jgi:hypothetical protein
MIAASRTILVVRFGTPIFRPLPGTFGDPFFRPLAIEKSPNVFQNLTKYKKVRMSHIDSPRIPRDLQPTDLRPSELRELVQRTIKTSR